MKASCPSDKVLNPATGKCVKADGKLGKKILAEMNKSKSPADTNFTDLFIYLIQKDLVVSMFHVQRDDLPLNVLSAILQLQAEKVSFEDAQNILKKWFMSSKMPKGVTIVLKKDMYMADLNLKGSKIFSIAVKL